MPETESLARSCMCIARDTLRELLGDSKGSGSLAAERGRPGGARIFACKVGTFVLGVALGGALVYLALVSGVSMDRAIAAPGFYASVPAPKTVPETDMRSPALSNSCLLASMAAPSTAGPQTFDACGFVIYSTDAVWNTRGNVDEAIEK